MLRHIRYFIFILLLILISPQAFALETLTVMGSSKINIAITDLTRKYAKYHDVSVNTSFAPEITQEIQITEEGAGDILITPDEEWIEELRVKGVVDINSKILFARDQLVLVGPKDNILTMRPSDPFPVEQILEVTNYEPSFVIGNPETLLEGRYSKEALRNLNVFSELEPYTLYIKDRRQMLDLVANHHAYGLFLYSSVVGRPDIRVIGALPEESYQPINYYAVVVASDNMDAARKFLDYLKSIPAKNILSARGLLSD